MSDMIDRAVVAKAMGDYHWKRYASRAEGGELSSPAVFTSHTWQDVQDIIAALPPAQPDAVDAMVKAAVEQERERCALIADAYADENIRMAGDTVLLDPVLHTPKGHKLTAKDFAKSEELVVSGAVHSAMFHAAQNIAAAIRAVGKA